MEDHKNSNGTSTLFKKWHSIRRGDIIEVQQQSKVVTHCLHVGYNIVLTFMSGEYAIIHEDDPLPDFTITGHYVCSKDHELTLKAR